MTTWSTSFPGLVMRACGDVEGSFEVHNATGRVMRQSSELSLCLECGPAGGVYHPDLEGIAYWLRKHGAKGRTVSLELAFDYVRDMAAKVHDPEHNRFVVHRHHTFVDGRDGPDIEHAHTDGAEAHRHTDAATAWFGHRGGGIAAPASGPTGPQLEYATLTEAESTFRVVGRYQYVNPGGQSGMAGENRKPSPEWGRAAWRRTMELTVAAARLRMYGEDVRLAGTSAIVLATNRIADNFGLTPVYEIEGWTPTPYLGLPPWSPA